MRRTVHRLPQCIASRSLSAFLILSASYGWPRSPLCFLLALPCVLGGWAFMCCSSSPIMSLGRLPVGLGSSNKIPCHTNQRLSLLFSISLLYWQTGPALRQSLPAKAMPTIYSFCALSVAPAWLLSPAGASLSDSHTANVITSWSFE